MFSIFTYITFIIIKQTSIVKLQFYISIYTHDKEYRILYFIVIYHNYKRMFKECNLQLNYSSLFNNYHEILL